MLALRERRCPPQFGHKPGQHVGPVLEPRPVLLEVVLANQTRDIFDRYHSNGVFLSSHHFRRA